MMHCRDCCVELELTRAEHSATVLKAVSACDLVKAFCESSRALVTAALRMVSDCLFLVAPPLSSGMGGTAVENSASLAHMARECGCGGLLPPLSKGTDGGVAVDSAEGAEMAVWTCSSDQLMLKYTWLSTVILVCSSRAS
eukprot:1162598-Amphidinium_carterae.2